MSGFGGEINIKLGMDMAEFVKNIDKATRKTADAVSSMDKSFKSLQGAVNGLIGVGAALAGAFSVGEIVRFGSEAVRAFGEAEAAASRLNSALEGSGRLTQANQQAIIDSAQRLSQITSAEDDAIIEATAKLANFAKQLSGPELAQAQQAIIGLSTVMGVDLNTAATQLGKTLSGASNTIGRTGIEISKTADQSQRLTEVLSATNTMFETATGLADTAEGRFANLQKQTGEVIETFGGLISEGLDLSEVYKVLTEGVVSLNDFLGENFQRIVELIKGTVELIGTVIDLGNAYRELILSLVGVTPEMVTMWGASQSGVGVLSGLYNMVVMVTTGLRNLAIMAQQAANTVTTAWQNIGNGFRYATNQINANQFTTNLKNIEKTGAQKNLNFELQKTNNLLRAQYSMANFGKGGGSSMPKSTGFSPTLFAGSGGGKSAKHAGGGHHAKQLHEHIKLPMQEIREAVSKAVDPFMDLTREMQNSVKTSTDFNTKFSEAQRLLESIKTPTQKFADEVERINLLYSEGFLTNQEQVNQMILKAAESNMTLATETTKANDNMNLFAGTLNNIGQSMTDTFVTAVTTGKVNFRDFINSVVQDLARLAFQLAVVIPLQRALSNMMGAKSSGIKSGGIAGGIIGSLGSLFSAIPGRASGGPVSAGKPYIVGEKRPELFVPRTSGTIIPQIPSGGGNSMTVVNNVTVQGGGSGDPGQDQEMAKGIAKQIEIAVSQQFSKMVQQQQRPGGQLYGGAY